MRTINCQKKINVSGEVEHHIGISYENIEDLCTICEYLLVEELYKIVSNWNKACMQYKNVELALSETNSLGKQIDKEILTLENAYSVIDNTLTKSAKDTKQFIGSEFFDLMITNNLNDLEHMYRIKNSVKVIKFKKCLILRDSIRCRRKIKSLAIQALFFEAEKLGLKTRGKGKMNPVLKFVAIISGIKDGKILDKYYRKHKSNYSSSHCELA